MIFERETTRTLVITIVSGTCMLITVVWSFSFIYVHCKNYILKPAKHKSLVIRILFIVPIFSFCAFFTILFPYAGYYLAPLRSVYEAFVVLSFYHLMENFAGGRERALATLSTTPDKIYSVPPFCCIFNRWCPETNLNEQSLSWVSLSVLQLLILTPITAALSILLHLLRFDQDIIYMDGFNSGSTMLALFGLFVFFRASFYVLRPKRTAAKFIAVKLGLIIVVVQKFLLNFLVRAHAIRDTNDDTAERQSEIFQSFLIDIEFLFVNFLHKWAFPVGEFDDASSNPSIADSDHANYSQLSESDSPTTLAEVSTL